MSIMRQYVIDQFTTLFKTKTLIETDTPASLSSNMEKAIFNWSIREIKFKGGEPSWDNVKFKSIYKNKFYGSNPFGWSSRRIGDLYCGMKMDSRANWKHLRKTRHDHNPINDALGNAEALLEIQKMGLKIKLV